MNFQIKFSLKATISLFIGVIHQIKIYFPEVFNLAKFHIPPVNLPDNIKQQVAQMIDSEDTENICLDQRLYSK